MNQERKKQVVDQLAKELENSYFYVVDSKGLNVASIDKIRSTCYKEGIKYKVVKNTLFKRALQQVKSSCLDFDQFREKALKGVSGLFIISPKCLNKPAKVIEKFHKETKGQQPSLKVAFVQDDLFIGPQQLRVLSSLKSKEELIAEVLQLLKAPLNNILSALQSPSNKLVSALQAMAEK